MGRVQDQASAADGLPLPPFELANRVGAIADRNDPWQHFLDVGSLSKQEIVAALPCDWSLDGRKVLDFGCGVGRTLRHFVSERNGSELFGCDIDVPSIEWLNGHLPQVRAVVNDVMPPVPFADGQFDLVYAISVFTHLSDSWSAWMAELHRVLAPGGLLFATFMGPPLMPIFTGHPADEDRIGMNVLRYDAPWDEGGPMVFHSPWWIRAHWGRAFELVSLAPDGFGRSDGWAGHGVALLRKRDVEVTAELLEAPEPGEPRETIALQASVREQWREIAGLRRAAGGADAHAQRVEVRAAEAERRLREVTASRSWQMTKPLRLAAAEIRQRRSAR